jgi:hypothetical protein
MNVLLTTAMTNTKAFDGTEAVGTAMVLCYTAGADGSRIDSITARLTSTNGAVASGTTAATLVRLWMNNGSANTVAANNQLIGEIPVPATAVTALATGALNTFTLPINLSIPAGYRVFAGLTTAVGGTNCAILITPVGGDY